MSIFENLAPPSEIDAAVRQRLAHSLAHIHDKFGDRLDIAPEQFTGALEKIRGQKQDPGVFARYFDLVPAINADDFAAASAILAEITTKAIREPEFSIIPYARDVLGPDYQRYPRLLFAEHDGKNPMVSPNDDRFQKARANLLEALDIISRVDAHLATEISGLFVLICASATNQAPGIRPFGGVTSLMVWGATFINIDAHESLWETVGFLVHEVTHGLLFGLSFENPLVLNPLQESYSSPLRTDPRPMDGIYHATQVCARMTVFNKAWLQSGLVDQKDEQDIVTSIEHTKRSFKDGLLVIREHGRLSEQASALLDQSARVLSVHN